MIEDESLPARKRCMRAWLQLLQRENFELGSQQVPESIGLRNSVLSRNGTELGRKSACQRTQSPEGPSTRYGGPRQNNARRWPHLAVQGAGELRSLWAVAEREELVSNILQVAQRNVAKRSACPSEPREVTRQFAIEFGEIARDHRYVETTENRLLRLAVEQETERRLETTL
jgi:hypothetical protein